MTFLAAVDDLRRTAEQLGSDRDRVARRVDRLLDGEWTGSAATAYAEAWEDWKRSAEVVRSGLATMADLLDATHADVTSTDLSAGSGLDLLTARLG